MKVLLIIAALTFSSVNTTNSVIKPLPQKQIQLKTNNIVIPLDLRKRVIINNWIMTEWQLERYNSPYIANSIHN